MIRDKPDVPPSAVAEGEIQNAPFCASIKMMWANKNFMILSLGFALVYGVYCGIGAVMSNLLNPYGYTGTDIATAGGASLLSGVIGALVVGVYLDYTAKYGLTHKMISIAVFLSSVGVWVVTNYCEKSLALLIIPMVFLGIASVSFFPASLSYGAELTYPL